MNPTISVIILTHNRARMLGECLRALAAQTRTADEILIINNGSTDTTAKVVEEARLGDSTQGVPPLAGLRMLEGSGQGAWEGRNQGVQAAQSEWIAFTDDDCIPESNWLAQVDKNARLGYDAVGGLVDPAAAISYPSWWHPEMAWTLGLSVPGMKGPLAGSVYYPQTANWAMARGVALAEPFRPVQGAFARQGTQFRASREDADLWRRLRRGPYATRVDPAMVVRHQVEEIVRFRLRFGENLRRAWLDGVALQQREPHREMILAAMDTIMAFPDDVIFGTWGQKQAPLREAAWKLLWTVRQMGQCAEFVRRKGWAHGWLTLGAYGARCALRQGNGRAKRWLRNAGIAALRLRHPRKPRAQARSIVVATSGFLGDMVMLHPFLSALKIQRREVSITLLCNEKGEEVFSHEPSVNRIVRIDQESSESATNELIAEALEEAKAELILVPYFHKVHPKALFSRPEARVVTFADHVGFPKRWWYDRADLCIPKPVGRPERDNLLRLFAEAGFRGPLGDVPLAFSPEEMEEMDEFLRNRQLDRFNLIILIPGSEKAEKLWVESRWAEVARYLKTEYEAEVALEGAPSEEGMCRRIADLSGIEPHLWCWPGIRRLALVLAEARLVVCCDNGPKHLAAAMDTPTLTLYGPTDERQWTPVRNPHRHGAVRACPWNLTDEERIGLEPDHQMKAISTDRVLRALDEMLAER